MTKIYYGFSLNSKQEGFSISSEHLAEYVKAAQSVKNFYKKPKEHSEHADGVIHSFINILAKSNFYYDRSDTKVYQIIEQLIREYGCDTNGIYSEEAQEALKNVYKYEGLNPAKAVLENKQPKADWKESFLTIKTACSSIKKNIGLSLKSLWQNSIGKISTSFSSAKRKTSRSLKSFWQKNKYYIAGTAGVGIIGVLSFFGMKKIQETQNNSPQINNEIKIAQQTLPDSSRTITWQESTPDSLQRIIENRNNYRQNLIQNSDTQANTNTTATDTNNISEELAKNIQKACLCAPSVVINDLQKQGILPTNYREKTLKEYRKEHPKSHISEVPSRILLEDIRKIYTDSPTETQQKLSDYISGNQKVFFDAMKASQSTQTNHQKENETAAKAENAEGTSVILNINDSDKEKLADFLQAMNSEQQSLLAEASSPESKYMLQKKKANNYYFNRFVANVQTRRPHQIRNLKQLRDSRNR